MPPKPRAEAARAMCGGADLHLHSCYSDGTYTPARLVRVAARRGLKALSLTDHDTVDGWEEARAEGIRAGVKVLPGVELSAQYRCRDVHLLAYGFDPSEAGLVAALRTYRQEREERLRRMIRRLQELGIHIALEDLETSPLRSALGRPHLADALRRKRIVASYQEAFDRYLNPGGAAFVPRPRLSLERARALVEAAGGVLVLAHPPLNLSREEVRHLVGKGIDGLEVAHPKLKPSQCRELRRLARTHSLLATGGSDCHGSARGEPLIGSVRVPMKTVEEIEAACASKSVAGAPPHS